MTAKTVAQNAPNLSRYVGQVSEQKKTHGRHGPTSMSAANSTSIYRTMVWNVSSHNDSAKTIMISKTTKTNSPGVTPLSTFSIVNIMCNFFSQYLAWLYMPKDSSNFFYYSLCCDTSRYY